METNRPKVGVGVIVRKDGKVLIGKRKSAHGDGSWGFPGGHLEFGEDIEECAKREVMEEVGINITNIKVGPFTNDIFENENKHYITIFVVCDHEKGEVINMEPEKCEKWERLDWENLPENSFLPIRNVIKQNYNPFL